MATPYPLTDTRHTIRLRDEFLRRGGGRGRRLRDDGDLVPRFWSLWGLMYKSFIHPISDFSGYIGMVEIAIEFMRIGAIGATPKIVNLLVDYGVHETAF